MTRPDDRWWMERALFHAERGRGNTSPNPIVGAVVVSSCGVVVGHGAHLKLGGPHAEVEALNRAGDLARGATLYCTLEPCSHTGRTPPCAERVAAAGIARVVVGARDRNPVVAGRGLDYLRTRGIEVVEGVLEAEATRQLMPFFTWIVARRPFVIAKLAVSRDGFIGRHDRRVSLTGPAVHRFFHRQRAEVDAIAVGSGTVLVDDPLLTPRGAYRGRPLTRVVFDWRGRVPRESRLFSTLFAGPVIMVVNRVVVEAQPARFAEIADGGVTVLQADARDVRPVLRQLADRNVVTLLLEGGSSLEAAFATAHMIDRVQRVVAPVTLGTGVPAPSHWANRLTDAATERTPLGDDELFEFDVHRTD